MKINHRAFEKANPDVKVKLETIDFKSGPENHNSIEAGIPRRTFDAPGRIIQYGKNGKLGCFLNDLSQTNSSKMLTMKTLYKQVKLRRSLYVFNQFSTILHGYEQENVEDAGVANLVKEGRTTDDFEKGFESA